MQRVNYVQPPFKSERGGGGVNVQGCSQDWSEAGGGGSVQKLQM